MKKKKVEIPVKNETPANKKTDKYQKIFSRINPKEERKNRKTKEKIQSLIDSTKEGHDREDTEE